MPGTLTPTCSVCGLRFASRPLLELHVREDHSQNGRAGAHRDDLTNAAARPPGTSDPAGTQPPAARPPSAAKEVITMTAAQLPRKPFGWARTALHGTIRAFRHANAELLLASEAMFRPPGAPCSRGYGPAQMNGGAAAGTQGADRAA